MTITERELTGYRRYLEREERSAATIEKYLRDAGAFAAWLGDEALSRDSAARWKKHLTELGRSPAGINGMLAGLNGLLRFMGREDCRVRALRVQRRTFRDPSRELTREEYVRLVAAAEQKGDIRLALVLETVCATGIRVSELRYITVEAVRAGRAEVALKGKVRSVLLPGKLARKLLKYAGKRGITAGPVFRGRNGNPLDRKRIWAMMKALCAAARVDKSKVFPHNLRHLFARTFYRKCRDIVKLADVLGHSSVETTRIYLIATGEEHARLLEGLRLIS